MRYTRPALTIATTLLTLTTVTTAGSYADDNDHNGRDKNDKGNHCYIKIKGNHNNSACNDITYGNNATTGNGHSVGTGLGTVLPPVTSTGPVTLTLKQSGELVGNWQTGLPIIPVSGNPFILPGTPVQLNCIAGYRPGLRHMFFAQIPPGKGIPAQTGYTDEISFEENSAAPPSTDVSNALNTLPICTTAIPDPPFKTVNVLSQPDLTAGQYTISGNNNLNCPQDHPYLDPTFPYPGTPSGVGGVQITAPSGTTVDQLTVNTQGVVQFDFTIPPGPGGNVALNLLCLNTPPTA
ncbi:hypothetical protein [Streptomyces sp. NBC_01264]|uniref:hypothetical protein n=1 Tax=Streptomyces sp. NBC_01264 TaxID=2903804 RepID=UPI0022582465|nr:hypothetical protein [Streptomyces sp. NBC_01264]MCX4784439.1 hypothetical protein [Streptomyces sp. NBC_01264]